MYIGMSVEVVCVGKGCGCEWVCLWVCVLVCVGVKVCRCVVQICTFVDVHVDVCGCMSECV